MTSYELQYMYYMGWMTPSVRCLVPCIACQNTSNTYLL